ncbi:uncharacterized protein CEXT_643901 [Caerostris extrusa]|uniref:Uncharacterized protein n=1 Tax=Caerostris extrusa TaxID=172846 RepID=A0AAV4Y5M3_CAEEX|nr:uncharacterized protein CEXT_643901 [Caerostris extrusa]
MEPTWKQSDTYTHKKRSIRSNNSRKRDARESMDDLEMSERDQQELASILKDDDEEEAKMMMAEKKDRHTKTKRQSSVEELPQDLKDVDAEEQESASPPTEDFQDWLRREYYRNMAKSFASMRRKRDGSSSSGGHTKSKTVKRAKKSVQSSTSLSEITDNLRNIEDQLFQDALQVMRGEGEDYEEDIHRQNRIFNDLSLAYDLETMRNAFFRLRRLWETWRMRKMRRSTIAAGNEPMPSSGHTDQRLHDLSDIMPDGPLKKLLLRACNWHEVCYTCVS